MHKCTGFCRFAFIILPCIVFYQIMKEFRNTATKPAETRHDLQGQLPANIASEDVDLADDVSFSLL